jgi:hypothetical protein
MDRSTIDRNYTPEEFDALMTAAKARAVTTREEAIDAFWSGAAAAMRRAWRRAFHSTGAQFDRPVNPAWPRALR